MVFLGNRSWVRYSDRIPGSQIKLRYDSKKHTVFSVDRPDAHLVLSPWITVKAEGEDMSDFFGSLQIADGIYLSPEDKLMLFAHQKGWFPVDPLTVMLRDGLMCDIRIFPYAHIQYSPYLR